MKRISIVGGGISGTFAAIRIKERHPDYLVSIYEHNDKLLKKIYATGNGKCNFANKGSLYDKYHNEEFALKIINEFNEQQIVNCFNNYGIKSKAINDLIYPYSESAETVALKLLDKVESLNIDVHLNTEVLDYKNNQLETSRGSFGYDVLIISVGGTSSPKLGSNGAFWPILKGHGYEIVPNQPSLCPIKVKENTKIVEGLRAKVTASVYADNKLIHAEEGELLFKKDGLSGMVIFNLTHYIVRLNNHRITIHLDFAKDMDGDAYSLVHPRIAKYLKDNHLDIHNTIYTFKSLYDFDYSQVTSGGIDIKELNDDLSSKKEKDVHFIGEIIDVDAICGGYNIMFALASAEKVAKSLD